MKQIETTCEVCQSLDEINDILTKQNFKIIRKSRIEDKYMSQFVNQLNSDNIISILEKSVLLRKLILDGKEINKITYKDKKYDNGILLYEEKTSVSIDSIEDAENLFLKLGFKNLVNVNYNCTVYSNDNMELAFQDVENLGMLVEYESKEDFDGKSSEEINKKKLEMFEEIRNLGLIVGNKDIRKANELILKSL